MKRTWQNFIIILNKTADLYAELLELGQAKKKVLVSGKADDLPPIVKQEEALVTKAGKFEAARQQLLAELAAHYGLNPKELSLAELEKESLTEGMHADVHKAGKRLKDIMSELSKINELNAQLAKQALFFVNCNINLLMQNTADSTYAPTNNVNQESSTARSRLLIDRKV